ncbi:hypothetical protein Btru_039560 [Bulinus truncatus]|nr:hypothetical protein Btru_039560 [Bulinus truncatus]
MKSDHRQSCSPRKVLAVGVALILLLGLTSLILTQTSSTSVIQQMFQQKKITEEHLEKHITALEEASMEKFNALLEKSKACHDIMTKTFNEITELKSSRASLECPESNMVESNSGRRVKKESIDNSGAIVYLQSFHQTLGVNDTMKADPNDLSTVTLWWEAAAILAWYMNPPQNTIKRHPCQNIIKFGNWPVCQDEQFVVRMPCLIYSFGIANDFSFDDHLGRMGCKVHSFDPSMNRPDHVRNENVTFYNLGLAPYDTNAWEPFKDSYVRNKQIWKVRTLKSVMSELNHTNKVIDILKIDIETTEWTVLSNIIQTDLLKNIRIFLIEYHLFPSRPFKEDYFTFVKLRLATERYVQSVRGMFTLLVSFKYFVSFLLPASCATAAPNPCQQVCTDIRSGGFYCECHDGYTINSDGMTCTGPVESNKDVENLVNDKDIVQVKSVDLTKGLPPLQSSAHTRWLKSDRHLVLDRDRDIYRGGSNIYNIPEGGNSKQETYFDLDIKEGGEYVEEVNPAEVPNNDLTSCGGHVCLNNGTCTSLNSKPKCSCPLGTSGNFCEKEIEIKYPKFYGTGYLALPVLRNSHKEFQVNLLFRHPFPSPIISTFLKLILIIFGGGPVCNHLYPCQICQSEHEKLEQRQRNEKETFSKLHEEFQEKKHATSVYAISMSWVKEWEDFVKKRTQIPPGPIENSRITVYKNSQPTLRHTSEYAQISRDMWLFLHQIYGGGPELIICQSAGQPSSGASVRSVPSSPVPPPTNQSVGPGTVTSSSTSPTLSRTASSSSATWTSLDTKSPSVMTSCNQTNVQLPARIDTKETSTQSCPVDKDVSASGDNMTEKKVQLEDLSTTDKNVPDQNRSVHDQSRLIEDQNRLTQDQSRLTQDQNRLTQDQNRLTQDQNRIVSQDQNKSAQNLCKSLQEEGRSAANKGEDFGVSSGPMCNSTATLIQSLTDQRSADKGTLRDVDSIETAAESIQGSADPGQLSGDSFNGNLPDSSCGTSFPESSTARADGAQVCDEYSPCDPPTVIEEAPLPKLPCVQTVDSLADGTISLPPVITTSGKGKKKKKNKKMNTTKI